jgi:CheY-like chemotaxis protein
MVCARVLVVEDESILALGVKSKLEKMGHKTVEIVDSGEKAIAAAKKHHPDIILMDIVLKGDMDGIEAAKVIKTQLDIPVIYVTAYADEDIIKRAKITEPYGYLIKPFRSEELNANMQMALYKHQRCERNSEKMKKKILSDFYEFLLQSVPSSTSKNDPNIKKEILRVFQKRLERELKNDFLNEMESYQINKDPGEDSSMESLLEFYRTFLKQYLSSLGIEAEFEENNEQMFLVLNNCPWIHECKKNHIFCLNCQAIAETIFKWTNLPGTVKNKSNIANGASNCTFTFNF